MHFPLIPESFNQLHTKHREGKKKKIETGRDKRIIPISRINNSPQSFQLNIEMKCTPYLKNSIFFTLTGSRVFGTKMIL
jgi:hypothetical protein